MRQYPQLELTPEQFEIEVKSILDHLAGGLSNYNSEHREVIRGTDGEYEIDVTLRFEAFGVTYLTLVECKRYKNPVPREKVQALHSKMQAVGAQKGIMFSTSGFQSGAVEFATAHGIALVHLQDGRTYYLRKAYDSGDGLIPWEKVPEYIPRVAGTLSVGESMSLVSADHIDSLRSFLGLVPR